MTVRGSTPTVILFDVDGTLIDSGGAGRRAMRAAFGEVCGRADACEGFSLGGMTDWGIVRAGLRAIGHDESDLHIEAVLSRYLDLLEGELARSAGFRVLPGVRETIEVLKPHAHLALGLGTGNVRRGAQLKLARDRLDAEFAFGGFGCDHEERAELLRAGFDRGAATFGRPASDCRRVVVGDTPRDIAAARALGAEVLAVATGSFDEVALRGEGAHVVARDLTDPVAVSWLIALG